MCVPCNKRRLGEICAVCDEPLMESTFINAMGSKFHEKCFRCETCNVVFTADGVTALKGDDNKPYCLPCHTSRAALARVEQAETEALAALEAERAAHDMAARQQAKEDARAVAKAEEERAAWALSASTDAWCDEERLREELRRASEELRRTQEAVARYDEYGRLPAAATKTAPASEEGTRAGSESQTESTSEELAHVDAALLDALKQLETYANPSSRHLFFSLFFPFSLSSHLITAYMYICMCDSLTSTSR